MPIYYTHLEQQHKIIVIVICHHRGMGARSRGACALCAYPPSQGVRLGGAQSQARQRSVTGAKKNYLSRCV